MTERISVVLVDDHELVRSAFKRLLADDPAIDVVGEASDGDAAVHLALSLTPRVVVMDYAMPGEDGLAAARRILHERPGRSPRRSGSASTPSRSIARTS